MWLLAAVVPIAATVTTWAPPGRLVDRDDYVDFQYARKIDAVRPGILLLGNSVLDWGVDEHLLGELLGTPVLKIGIGGSASAWWYLLVKNVLPAANHRPDVLVRMRTRRAAEGEPPSPGLDEYTRALAKYAAREGIPLLDFSDESSLTVHHFAHTDHLNKQEGRTLFTHLLAERLRKEGVYTLASVRQ